MYLTHKLMCKIVRFVFDSLGTGFRFISAWLAFPAVAIFILKVMGQAFLLLRGARSKTGKLRQWERPVREILND